MLAYIVFKKLIKMSHSQSVSAKAIILFLKQNTEET